MKLGTEHLIGTTLYVLRIPARCAWVRCTTCSPDAVVFLTSREEYEPYYVDDRKYFELATFYDEFAKPWCERRLPMRYEPHQAAIGVYRFWQDRNGGGRRVADAPSG